MNAFMGFVTLYTIILLAIEWLVFQRWEALIIAIPLIAGLALHTASLAYQCYKDEVRE